MKRFTIIATALLILSMQWFPGHALAQQDGDDEPQGIGEEKIIPDLPTPGDIPQLKEETPADNTEDGSGEIKVDDEGAKGLDEEASQLKKQKEESGVAKDEENRWHIEVNLAVVMIYTFNDSPNSFTIKYRWSLASEANSATAIIKGDANVEAEVQGALSKWPTGECRLSINIPKAPFEMTFKRTDEDKGSIKLIFKKAISEEWSSTCRFTDAPDARLDTRGPPEQWLWKAIDRAEPSLKSLVSNLGNEESATTVIIKRQTFDDNPIGKIEVEGSGVVTIKPNIAR